MVGVALGIDAEGYPEVKRALEGEPAMTPFAENFNRAVTAARDAAAEAARERAKADDALARADKDRAMAHDALTRADKDRAMAHDALTRADKDRAMAHDALTRAGDALARERELVLDVVALRFNSEIARRVRPVLETIDDPNGIYDVRSRAMESASAEELLHRLGLSNGRSP